MKLFELRPKENLPKSNDPWEKHYDCCFGLIIRAETESEARNIAHENAGYERGSDHYYDLEDDDDDELADKVKPFCYYAWLDEMYSTCTELKNDGKAGMIIKDVAYG